MMRSAGGVGLLALACCVAYGQAPSNEQPAFEVASIKPSNPPGGVVRRVGCSGGPGSSDPGLLNCVNMSLSNLVTMAYEIFRYQVTFADWMDSTRFDIDAKVPPGTTKAQLRLMEQNLLVERFKLAVHHEKKDMQLYELTVAKDGPKLKETEEAPAPKEGEAASPRPPAGPAQLKIGSDGFPELPPNANTTVMMNGRARSQQIGVTMEAFAKSVSGQLDRPVTDATGLKGKYDIVLSWAPEGGRREGPPPDAGTSAGPPEADSLPTYLQAVRGLGLKLEQKKGPADILVIDHMEKTPVEN